MTARKLQQDMDKCFKKIAEGILEFDSTLERIEQSTNAAQKEKLEGDLKRVIKKLQRMRDQVKSWAALNEIKDKAPLLEQRQRIETVSGCSNDSSSVLPPQRMRLRKRMLTTCACNNRKWRHSKLLKKQ